jgi:hypothetical protein
VWEWDLRRKFRVGNVIEKRNLKFFEILGVRVFVKDLVDWWLDWVNLKV